MVASCFCYMADERYLLPSFVSATQARRNVAADRADVVLVCIGDRTAGTDLFDRLCAGAGILFRRLPHAAIEERPMAFARFYLGRVLDRPYDTVVYLDGDTQVSSPLDALVEAPLPRGRFLAARDPMAVMIDGPGRQWTERRRYFTSIGIPVERQTAYFNSGVLRFHAEDWREISRECLRMSRTSHRVLRFPDQDLLNIAFAREQVTMSFKWNFPIFFMNAGLDRTIRPRIHHFMSNPRPWQGAFAPWGRPWSDVYRELVEQNAGLRPFLQPLRRRLFAKYKLQQIYKRFWERQIWTRPAVRARIEGIERDAFV